ncbi:methyltransferase domain-containing protein [Thalassobaculum sp.]|uniref:methyltransferase domain-containing protein n=1 Tax=Thalassobaculum sp. TaxID=2022740 RepID=UPI003B5B3D26
MSSSKKRLETEADVATIITFSGEMGEVRESLVDEIMVPVAERFPDRPLCQAPPRAADLDLLRQHRPWGYALELFPGVSGAHLDREAPVVDFSLESAEALSIRMSLLDKALAEFAPVGSLLDLETDCGLIPMKLAERIGGRIVGIDRREEAIRRARVLHTLSGQANRRFQVADPYAYLVGLKPDAFDCVSALGLVHRLTDPIRLLRLMHEKTARLVLIDTVIHNVPAPGWIRRGPPGAPGAGALQPTYRGMIDSLYQVGFESVTEVAPAPSLLAAIAQQTPYHSHRRALFVAQKWAV